MKILHVIDSGGVYGAEAMLLNLMAEQRDEGEEPVLASIGTPGEAEKALEKEARGRGLCVVPFRMKGGPNPAGAWRILCWAKNERVDVIHCHGYKGNILLGGVPRFLRRAPLVTTLHGWTASGAFSRIRLYELLDTVMLRFFDRVVLVNEAARQHPRLRRLPPGRLAVVPNGIPAATTGDEAPEASLVRFMNESVTVCAAGRLSREKGFGYLVEAISLLVRGGLDLHLVILGEGPERDTLERRVIELGLEKRVRMPGYLPQAARVFPHCRLFAMPSLTEGLPMVLLEAMSAGLPVVATAVGGIPELFCGGDAGVLVPAADPAALADGMAGALRDGAATAERARRAGALVEARYSARSMARGYRAVYETVLGAGSEAA